VLDFTPVPVPYLTAEHPAPGVEVFRPDVPDFALWHVSVGPNAASERGTATISLPGPAIALCVDGAVQLAGATGSLALARGESVYVTPEEASVTVSGTGTLFFATPNTGSPAG
jgi:Phosphomannose isomerase